MTSSRYVAIVCAVLVLPGCASCRHGPSVLPEAGPIDVPRTCTVDDAPPVCDPGGTGTTATFVVAHLGYPEATPDAVIPGFDLDHSNALVCGAEDWLGNPPLAEGCGIDNQLAPFLSALAGAAPQDAIDAGRLLLLLVVGGIDDRTDDPCVDVRIAVGVLQASVAAPTLAPDGGLAPSQTFDLDSVSIAADRVTWVYRFDAGRIVGGRLEAAAGIALTPVPTQLVPTHDARLTAGLTSTGLQAGVIGGRVVDGELIDALDHDPSLCSSVVAPIFLAQSDLDPAVTVLPDGGSPTRCGAISVGLTFDAVPASLSSCTLDTDCPSGRTCLAGHCAVSFPDGGPCR